MKLSKKKIKTIIALVFIMLILIIASMLYIVLNSDSNTFELIIIEPSEYYEALSREDIILLSGGNAEFIRFGFDNPQIKGIFTTGTILTPEDAVKALTSVRDIMNIGSFSYFVTKSAHHDNAFYLTQEYKGIEVYNGYFRVHATIEGEPLSVTGRYLNIVDLNVIPTLSSDEARKLIPSDIKTIWETRLVVYERYDIKTIHLCWIFDYDERRAVVDAHTGEVIVDGATIIS